MNFIYRSPLLAGLSYAKGQVLTRLNMRSHTSGSTALSMSIEDAADYARRAVADYITYGADGDPRGLLGKDILEIGPGDNLGVALVLLAHGARSVTCVDGFAPKSDSERNKHLYAAIYASLSDEGRERVRDVVTLHSDGTATVGGDRLISRYSVPIDRVVGSLGSDQYDVVISRAVLEHLRDLAMGWQNMAQSLRSGGEMWHKVDFRCHTLFEQIHPLYFLTIPNTLWNMISQPDPTLNRLRLPTYRQLAARDFSNSRCYITHIVAEKEFSPHPEHLIDGTHYSKRHLDAVRAVRPRLQKPFADYSDEDMLVTGVFLITRCPLK